MASRARHILQASILNSYRIARISWHLPLFSSLHVKFNISKYHGQSVLVMLCLTPTFLTWGIWACCAGVIEYWDASSHTWPEEGLNFGSKMDTDLYTLAKAKTTAVSLDVSRDGSQFAMFCADRHAPPSHQPYAFHHPYLDCLSQLQT